MRKHIVCLGDSNTHGYCADPADCADGPVQRFNEDERWTCLLQRALGSDYLVLEEGLSGRTTVFPDPLYEGLAAVDYLYPCLKSHDPVDLLIVMLGTNDTKEYFGANAICWGTSGRANILVVAPPAMDPRVETAPASAYMGRGCAEKSRQLPPLLAETARRCGCHFLSAGECQLNEVDFMHLTRQGHAQLARLLSRHVPALLASR